MRLRSESFLVLTIVLASGCAEEPQPGESAPPLTPPPGSPSPTDGETPPGQPEPPREILNETLTYPRVGGATPDEERANVAAAVRRLLLRFQAQRECPGGYYDAPRLQVVAPNGTVLAYDILNPSQVRPQPYSCDGQPSRPGPVVDVPLESLAGDWVFRTSGEGTMQVDLVLIANPANQG